MELVISKDDFHFDMMSSIEVDVEFVYWRDKFSIGSKTVLLLIYQFGTHIPKNKTVLLNKFPNIAILIPPPPPKCIS